MGREEAGEDWKGVMSSSAEGVSVGQISSFALNAVCEILMEYEA